MIIPWDRLPQETLDRLIEEYVSRDGTDYGTQETPLKTRVAQVRRALASGDAVITFDTAIQSATIVLRDRLEP